MKKNFFITLVAFIMINSNTFGQSSLVATLSHKGSITVFYSGTALKEALAAADHGDIISLSGGRFDAANIKKAITLRGAGMEEDIINGTQPTRIVGDFSISIPDDVTSKLSIEGICNTERIMVDCTLNNATFQKCSFNRFTYSYSNIVNALTVVHCKIEHIEISTGSTGRFINSYVGSAAYYASSGSGAMEFTNCFLGSAYTEKSVFTNCFLVYDDHALDSSNMCYNCVSWGNTFNNVSKISNTTLKDEGAFMALFKTGSFYEMTDVAKMKYVGNDGTEVGMYGGNLPYSVHILSPQITKCNVAAKTTADGKLSVDIEVKVAE